MKKIVTSALLILTITAVYMMTIGADDGWARSFPEKGEEISRSIESIDP